MAEMTTSQVEEQLAKHNFMDRGGSQKDPEGIRFRLFSIGTQSNLLLEVGSEDGIRVLLSTKMAPLVERLNQSGAIVLDDSKAFTLAKDETVKFVSERGEPYWWSYKAGDYSEATLLKAIDLYESMLGWGEEIMSAPPAAES